MPVARYPHRAPDGPLRRVTVRARPGSRTRGILVAGALAVPVALGRGGIKANKFEGDGGTPRGTFRPMQLWWRADRAAKPSSFLPARPIRPEDAWSEDPADRNYNRPVRRKPEEPGDRLRRSDHLYDVIVELDHNTRPRISKRGSAVFIHLAREGFAPTAGCVALKAGALRRLLARIGPKTKIVIG